RVWQRAFRMFSLCSDLPLTPFLREDRLDRVDRGDGSVPDRLPVGLPVGFLSFLFFLGLPPFCPLSQALTRIRFVSSQSWTTRVVPSIITKPHSKSMGRRDSGFPVQRQMDAKARSGRFGNRLVFRDWQ